MQHARGDFLRRHLLALHFDPGIAVVGLDDLVRDHADVLLHDVVFEAAADEALDREHRVLRIGHRLALGRLADQHFVVLRERDDRRRGAIAFAVLDHARLAAFHDRDARVRRAEVDADDFAHGPITPEESISEDWSKVAANEAVTGRLHADRCDAFKALSVNGRAGRYAMCYLRDL